MSSHSGQYSIGFNSQPPEGGWKPSPCPHGHYDSFNSQPPEGGWAYSPAATSEAADVSTHSRPKAAGNVFKPLVILFTFQLTAARRRLVLSPTNTKVQTWFQLTAARRRLGKLCKDWFFNLYVSTHSRPKAAGGGSGFRRYSIWVSTHSRPKAAGHFFLRGYLRVTVSTHSRPKAAGQRLGK